MENTSNIITGNLPRTCLLRMQSVYGSLKRAEKKAADALLSDPMAIAEHSIVEASRQSGASEATWFRLSKKLGYSGFHALKEDLQRHLDAERNASLGEGAQHLYEDIDASTSPREVVNRVFASSINALQDTLNILDEEQYRRAVEALDQAEKIVIAGVGDGYAVARSAYQKLFRAGFDVYQSADQDLQLLSISRLKPGDVLLAISYSGRTKSLADLVRLAGERGCQVVLITNFPNTPLAKQADILLQTAAFARYSGGEIASKRTVQLCMIESLYVNLLLRRQKALSPQMMASNEAIELNKM